MVFKESGLITGLVETKMYKSRRAYVLSDKPDEPFAMGVDDAAFPFMALHDISNRPIEIRKRPLKGFPTHIAGVFLDDGSVFYRECARRLDVGDVFLG